MQEELVTGPGKVWVLEDHPEIHEIYRDILGERFNLRFFQNVDELEEGILDLRSQDTPEVLIADLILGDFNFNQYLEKKRGWLSQQLGRCRIVVISSLNDLPTLRQCYQLGASDYIVKPFKETELLAKLEKLVDELRYNIPEDSFSAIEVDGVLVKNLTTKQIKLLSIFLDSPQRLATRPKIVERIWPDTQVHPKTLDVHLYNLRRKIKNHGLSIVSEGRGKWRLKKNQIDPVRV